MALCPRNAATPEGITSAINLWDSAVFRGCSDIYAVPCLDPTLICRLGLAGRIMGHFPLVISPFSRQKLPINAVLRQVQHPAATVVPTMGKNRWECFLLAAQMLAAQSVSGWPLIFWLWHKRGHYRSTCPCLWCRPVAICCCKFFNSCHQGFWTSSTSYSVPPYQNVPDDCQYRCNYS